MELDESVHSVPFQCDRPAHRSLRSRTNERLLRYGMGESTTSSPVHSMKAPVAESPYETARRTIDPSCEATG
jgi:hypothetical protein